MPARSAARMVSQPLPPGARVWQPAELGAAELGAAVPAARRPEVGAARVERWAGVEVEVEQAGQPVAAPVPDVPRPGAAAAAAAQFAGLVQAPRVMAADPGALLALGLAEPSAGPDPRAWLTAEERTAVPAAVKVLFRTVAFPVSQRAAVEGYRVQAIGRASQTAQEDSKARPALGAEALAPEPPASG